MLRLIAIAAAGGALLAGENGADSPEFFETRIRPVLARNCFSCHTQTKMGGLELNSREALLKGGGRGPAVVPREPERSLLVHAVRHDDGKLKMPPSGKLEVREIADIEAWVKAGAVWPEHAKTPKSGGWKITPEQRDWWAFRPVTKPQPPVTKDSKWPRTDIDRFILARIEQAGLKPAATAERRALIRRAYYDLIGLPPRAEEIERFAEDKSPEAFAKVVDRLLESPRYGERWGRHWLDLARYSDDKLNSTQDEPYENAFRYRDWVIRAFNEDMPYDLFVKAQLAGDVLDRPDRDKLIAGLGFYALSPQFQEDRVDATGRVFLGLTVACAQCHDHKFDPIPTRDYYALLGVFTSTSLSEFPLAPPDTVTAFKERMKAIDDTKQTIADFQDKQAAQLAEMLAMSTAEYSRSAREVIVRGKSAAELATSAGLDAETLGRWVNYLQQPSREHPFLDGWEKDSFSDSGFQTKLLAVIDEKKKVDDTNYIRLGGSQKRSDLAGADLLSLPRDDYFLWRDFAGKDKAGKLESGVYYYKGDAVERFLSGVWKDHLTHLRARLPKTKDDYPKRYPFLHTVEDKASPKNERIRIRGSMTDLGDEAKRSFLSIFANGEPAPFQKGSGRLELAESIGRADNPLTARVMVNRIWSHHFGRAIVGTPSNFGQLGEKPSHPELLDYLAARFVENGWSMKKLHREIMLSRVYQLAAAGEARNTATDPDNRLFWRANRRRLDVEPLRDTLLAVTGELEDVKGGEPVKLTEVSNRRRTVYGFVSRRRLDGTLALFDFPNPNNTSEQRIQTATPLQELFFLNSGFLEERAKALVKRVEETGPDAAARIRAAYRMLYGRVPAEAELRAGLAFLGAGAAQNWPRYAQALLSSNEILFIN